MYNVRYGWFNLGQVRIRLLGPARREEHPVYNTRALIDSYRGVPFVDLHAVFESTVDSSAFSHLFVAKMKENDTWTFARYTFEYGRDRVLIDVGDRDTMVARRETLAVASHYQDGLSLFFYARAQLLSGLSVDVPTLVKEKESTTHLDFTNKVTSVDIDAVDYPIDVVEFEGAAHFVGIFGLTGDFEGWFSNDEARVPILAKMKVLIGSVTIELMEWKRPGWTPPRAGG